MQILREEASLLGYKKSFSIFDTADTGKIISELLGAPDKQDIRVAQSMMSNWKAGFISPEQAASWSKPRPSSASRCSTHATRKLCAPIRRWILMT